MKKKTLVVIIVEAVLLIALLVACACFGRAKTDAADPATLPQAGNDLPQAEDPDSLDAANAPVSALPEPDGKEKEAQGGKQDTSSVGGVDVNPFAGSDETGKPSQSTKPTESTQPVESTRPADTTKPAETTQPTTEPSAPEVEIGVGTLPNEFGDPTEPEPTEPETTQPKPTEPKPTEPTNPSGNGSGSMTYERYIAMSSEEQSAYRDTFASLSEFFTWYNAAKEAYDNAHPGIDVGDGSIDLEDLMNGNG